MGGVSAACAEGAHDAVAAKDRVEASMTRRSVVAERSVAALCGADLVGTNAEQGATTNNRNMDFMAVIWSS